MQMSIYTFLIFNFFFYSIIRFIVVRFIQIETRALVFQLSLCVHRVDLLDFLDINTANHTPELGELKIYRQLIEIYY